ncbi:hypothetical protein HT031_002774 [Scenedesmus sp. PABB004]|nr:hypothetical protein HT031_002774 [Scenedesmus sp. PABB004]
MGRPAATGLLLLAALLAAAAPRARAEGVKWVSAHITPGLDDPHCKDVCAAYGAGYVPVTSGNSGDSAPICGVSIGAPSLPGSQQVPASYLMPGQQQVNSGGSFSRCLFFNPSTASSQLRDESDYSCLCGTTPVTNSAKWLPGGDLCPVGFKLIKPLTICRGAAGAPAGLVNAVGYYAPSTSAGCGSSINAGPLCGGLPNRLAKRINSTRSLDQTWCTGCRDLRFFCQTSVSQAATAGIAYPAEQLCVRWADAPAKSCDSLPPPETLPPNARPWPELCLFIQDQGLCATRCKAGYTGTPTTLCDNGSWRLPAQGACVQASCDPLTTPPVNGRWPLRCRTPDKRVPLGASCTARCNNGTIPFPAAVSICKSNGTHASWFVQAGTCKASP